MPEWSKGVDSSSTSASCMDPNPTAVRIFSQSTIRFRNLVGCMPVQFFVITLILTIERITGSRPSVFHVHPFIHVWVWCHPFSARLRHDGVAFCRLNAGLSKIPFRNRVPCSTFSSLLAMIKCTICSYQCGSSTVNRFFLCPEHLMCCTGKAHCHEQHTQKWET